MAARAHVPQFGKWESEDNVPYTVYFDNARKGKGGKMINPNDPQENPDMFPNIAPAPAPAHASPSRTRAHPPLENPDMSPNIAPAHASPSRSRAHPPQENPDMFPNIAPAPAHAPPSRTRAQAEEPLGRGAARLPHERRTSREDGNLRQFVDSPARTDNVGRRTSGESPHHHYGHGSHSGRPTRQSAGSEHSFERSPIHSHHQAKLTGRGGSSPAWDSKNSHDSSHGTHVKSRMKPVARVDESPDRGAAVPRFGDWDESNPQSADNYTHIFNKVRLERHNVPSNVPGNNLESSYHMMQKQNANGNRKGCCFPWL